MKRIFTILFFGVAFSISMFANDNNNTSNNAVQPATVVSVSNQDKPENDEVKEVALAVYCGYHQGYYICATGENQEHAASRWAALVAKM